jgi:lipase chaperone LimK
MDWPPRPFGRLALTVGLLAAAVGGAIVLCARRETDPPERVQPPPAVVNGAVAARRQPPPLDAGQPRAAALPADETPPLPHSLEGTEVDGWLGVDDDGRLVVTPGARWFFDYFLSATGEEAPEQIRARIVSEIDKRLPPTAAREAVDLLDRYLAYRDRVRTLLASGAPDDVERRLAQLRDIRRQAFGAADAAALFGDEEAVQALDIERRRVLSDATLSPDERERRLGDIEQQLPPAARQARADSATLIQLNEDERQLRGAGASPEDLHALREQRFGGEAADRLDALDRERAAWQQRLDDYRSARRALEDSAALSTDARARAVETLLAERFSPEERLRVEALDATRDGRD